MYQQISFAKRKNSIYKQYFFFANKKGGLVNPERVGPIIELNKQLSEPYDVDQIARDELAALALYKELPVVPTIGSEVEVNHSTIFPEFMQKYFGERDELGRFKIKYSDLDQKAQYACDEEYAVLRDSVLPDYEAVVGAGIPAGEDAFWEFAHDPTYSYKTLAAETSQLFDLGLIPEGFDHSLHVTLGNIDPNGGGPFIIVSGLELMSGAANRIRFGMLANHNRGNVGWARKGGGGVVSRENSGKVQLGQTHAVEFRTLRAPDKRDTVKTLRAAQMLGTALLGFRQYKDGNESIEVAALAAQWVGFRGSMNDLWEDKGLPAKSWGTPRLHKDIWGIWADTIDEGTLHEQGLAYETVQKVAKIVTKTETIITELTNEIGVE